MSIALKFGKKLKDIRKELKMTQEDLAFESKLTVYYISKLERGVANPSLDTLNKIAKALETTLSELFKNL